MTIYHEIIVEITLPMNPLLKLKHQGLPTLTERAKHTQSMHIDSICIWPCYSQYSFVLVKKEVKEKISTLIPSLYVIMWL